MKRVLIIEDDCNISRCLEKIVRSIDRDVEVYAFMNVKDAYQCMLEHKIDLFMVDIILDTEKPGDTSGLYFAEKIRMINRYKFTPLIFITSLEDSKCISYATFHCYSFIEKPFDPKNVKNIVADCLEFPEHIAQNKTLFFRKDGIVISVARDDIIYVESINHVLHIHTINKDELKIPYITMKRFLEMADSDMLIRCRRNTVIHQKYFKNADHANGIIQLADGHRVEIGLTYRNAMRKIFNDTRDDLHS